MVRLEALNALYGDALLLHYESKGKQRLWLIDGGPTSTWSDYSKNRLAQLPRKDGKLTVDLAMLSHVDDDHVNGLLKMTKAMVEDHPSASFIEIRRFWHNSFADLVGSPASLKKGLASLAGAQNAAAAVMAADSLTLDVAGAPLDDWREFAVLATIGKGRELRDYLTTLGLTGNDPFGGTISSASGKKPIDGANVTIVGPIASRLEKFRKKWEAESGDAAALASLFSDKLDISPTNLSSLVMLVEIDGKKILLTGDARGDDIVDGFKDAGLGGDLPMKLDILKLPHHGSKRNITEDFLKKFPADHYVLSADGRHGNPDKDTIRAIVQVRANDRYTMHCTNTIAGIPELLASLKPGKKFEYAFRDPNEPSIMIDV
ncbi:MAG: hypothetical protein Q8M24_09985 [Pseudolabrys sp.]|nr:hypothetical protein [Pseudolabrys sp.]MDP2295776.1 hypothetical protein [Pseudolabrys sp.]